LQAFIFIIDDCLGFCFGDAGFFACGEEGFGFARVLFLL